MPASWQPPDLDEIHPDHFIVNNEKVRPFLRGEGERQGKFFQLQSWRREGWAARVRAAGFNVRTLEDRVRSLKAVQRDLHRGAEAIRPLSSARERIAAWDGDRLRWRDLPVLTVEGKPAVRLRVNEAIRRRKSRSGGDFFITVAERTETIGLRPVRETEALLHAYSILASEDTPAVLRFTRTADGYHVPADQATLPGPHQEALDRLSGENAEPWTFVGRTIPLAEEVFEKLGIELERRAKGGLPR